MNPKGYYVDWNSFAFGYLQEVISVVPFFFQEIHHYSWHLKNNINVIRISELPNDSVSLIIGISSIVMVLRKADPSLAKSPVITYLKT